LTTDGSHSFSLYINGENRGTGTLTLSEGEIIKINSSTNSSLTYFGGVRYSGNSVSMRVADGKVWVNWAVYPGGTMADFTAFASLHNNDADEMYYYRNTYPIYDQDYYYGSPYNPVYDTPKNIYDAACQDHPGDAPPVSTLNQAIRVLNNHRNTGVGAYENTSAGYLIAYYFRRNQSS